MAIRTRPQDSGFRVVSPELKDAIHKVTSSFNSVALYRRFNMNIEEALYMQRALERIRRELNALDMLTWDIETEDTRYGYNGKDE